MPFITQVLIPKHNNSGRRFDREQYNAFHSRMIRQFGGWTLARSRGTMTPLTPSALISEEGRRVLLRIQGRQYDLTQPELRNLLGLPAGDPGLGITVDRDQLRFEFSADSRTVETTAKQLHRRLAKHAPSKT